MTNFVKIQKAAFECLVLPHNIDKVEAALAKLEKPTKRDPFKRTRYDNARDFPVYAPGMSTGEYVSRYNSLNNRLSLTHTHDVLAYDHPAAQYDPNVPLCVEDTNPDYVPGVDDAPAKPKRLSKQAAYIAELERMVSRLAGFASHYASESAMLAGGADMVREARELIGGAK